ncbi:hypothetical protein SCP_1301950 [Sparassis crispa]|uniref:Choline/carnitine acyltransferase domain-containing protein n=1 Tax=Sparassis crispa TaxID=139825 RepID=A0A401H1Z6_9APHY|nr:hypothetical protein SCP_1301950 [Sparassis crispa]GBE88380.1 hypothetical protein SCP_1301950 [Sparassis crispa]
MATSSGTRTARPRSSTGSKPTLPRLPVPDLHQTLEKYVRSLEPFLLEDASSGGSSYDSAHSLRLKWAEDFESSLGKICQERLLLLDRVSPHNWLDDNFWLKKAYHEWRAPLLVNSNWWLAFHNDPTIPEDVILGLCDATKTGTTHWQVRRAAWLVYRVLDFKIRLERQELHPNTTRAGIWLQETTAKIWNRCRLPQPQCDTFTSLPKTSIPEARTLLVALHDWFYVLEVLDESFQPIRPGEIESKLRAIVADVEDRLARGERAVPVGVLSADDRDIWAENLCHLLALSPINHDVFRAISQSIFALSLDPYTYVLPSSPNRPNLLPATCTASEVTAHLHNVRSAHTEHPAHNRWFDKPFTLIVESNTRAGAMGEHSPCDALVPSIVAEYAVVQALDERAFASEDANATANGWERLDWIVDERIQRECVAAEERAREIVDDSDDGFLWYGRYGADWIKNVARLAPDAYVQMALQLAWFRSRGSFTATYETALTRLFQNGRTETIRTLTTDSRAFVLAMVDPEASSDTRHRLLSRAVQTHTNLTRLAATGRGIDRHLLGLQQMLLDGESHALLEDDLFVRSQTWKLSTSGLSTGHQFRGTGFGAPYNDGYGINCKLGPCDSDLRDDWVFS